MAEWNALTMKSVIHSQSRSDTTPKTEWSKARNNLWQHNLHFTTQLSCIITKDSTVHFEHTKFNKSTKKPD